jgi:hypothetical protein
MILQWGLPTRRKGGVPSLKNQDANNKMRLLGPVLLIHISAVCQASTATANDMLRCDCSSDGRLAGWEVDTDGGQHAWCRCITCGLKYQYCPGHFGHIRLPAPLFNPLVFT